MPSVRLAAHSYSTVRLAAHSTRQRCTNTSDNFCGSISRYHPDDYPAKPLEHF